MGGVRRVEDGPKSGRSSKPTTRKAQKLRLDKLCRELTFLRDGHRCARCSKTSNLQWCHVFSRRHLRVRWDSLNSFTGCAGCHLWWHSNPVEAVEWYRQFIGVHAFETLRLRARSTAKVDFDAMERALKNSLGVA